MRNAPVSTAILVICVLVFFIEQAKGGSEKTGTALRFGAMYTPYVKKGQYWRLVTSIFVHFGVWHIIANMYSLYALGPAAEQVFGSGAFLIIYLGAGIFGNLLTMARESKTGHYAVSAGASGAIFGLMGAFLVLALNPQYGWRVSLRSLLVTLAINLVYGAVNRRINQWAHLGGLLGGMILTELVILAA